MNYYDNITPGNIPGVYLYFYYEYNILEVSKMTFEEWKEMSRREEITATEIVRIERDFMRQFDQCEDMDEKRQKYEELYKKLDDNGDYEKMKYLWKVAHKLNIHIKK